ncbi:MAG TPA: hypothetical protein VFJ95_02805, partial [Gammaproteobacteria bacterium]|nr:hypothetical protein [Gammaproteobacteria bacterium]
IDELRNATPSTCRLASARLVAGDSIEHLREFRPSQRGVHVARRLDLHEIQEARVRVVSRGRARSRFEPLRRR